MWNRSFALNELPFIAIWETTPPSSSEVRASRLLWYRALHSPTPLRFHLCPLVAFGNVADRPVEELIE